MLLKGTPVVSFTRVVDWQLPKRPFIFNGRLANRQLASLVKRRHWYLT